MKDILQKYWSAYGGWKALFDSPYFRISVITTLCLFPHWAWQHWWDDVISIMPNLLGFSLGGYAMWISIGDEGFRRLISGTDTKLPSEPSPFIEVNSTFVHFIILQLSSITLAITAKAFYFPPSPEFFEIFGAYLAPATLAFYFISYLVFIYALLSALATTLALLRISFWYDQYQTNIKKKEKDERP